MAKPQYDLIVVGGGAAGFFGAICAADLAAKTLRIAILEQGSRVLQKVRISGGGRCNVTHAEFDPRQLAKHYPRGSKELLGPFTKFAPGDTMGWFEDRGVALKIEEDGRVFPVADDSEAIISALNRSVTKHSIEVLTKHKVSAVSFANGLWSVQIQGSSLSAKQVLLATGSTPSAYAWVAKLGINLVDAVPSLFTFKVANKTLHDLKGLSVVDAKISIPALRESTHGSLLITHWGFSGPAILKASAVAAIGLHQLNYQTEFLVSWVNQSEAACLAYLQQVKQTAGAQTVKFSGGIGLPKRLWTYLVDRGAIPLNTRWADISKSQLLSLAQVIVADRYQMNGQTRFKEEFVTAGGIDLTEIDFRRFSVRKHQGLYVAGELLNIDGVTGGFNFQAAWTGGYLAGKAVADSV